MAACSGGLRHPLIRMYATRHGYQMARAFTMSRVLSGSFVASRKIPILVRLTDNGPDSIGQKKEAGYSRLEGKSGGRGVGRARAAVRPPLPFPRLAHPITARRRRSP